MEIGIHPASSFKGYLRSQGSIIQQYSKACIGMKCAIQDRHIVPKTAFLKKIIKKLPINDHIPSQYLICRVPLAYLSKVYNPNIY